MTVWTLPVPIELADSLERLLDDATSHDIEFLVGFGNGFKVEIFANEHPPPHFHVTYKNDENTFRISDAAPMHAEGLNRHFRHIRKWQPTRRRPSLHSRPPRLAAIIRRAWRGILKSLVGRRNRS